MSAFNGGPKNLSVERDGTVVRRGIRIGRLIRTSRDRWGRETWAYDILFDGELRRVRRTDFPTEVAASTALITEWRIYDGEIAA